jgi:hypothetical protein
VCVCVCVCVCVRARARVCARACVCGGVRACIMGLRVAAGRIGCRLRHLPVSRAHTYTSVLLAP